MISHAVRRRVCQARFNSTEAVKPAPRLSSSWGDIVIRTFFPLEARKIFIVAASRQDIIAEKQKSRSMASTLLQIRKQASQEPDSVSEPTTFTPVALAIPTNSLYINPRGMPSFKRDKVIQPSSFSAPASTPGRSQTGSRQMVDSRVQERTQPLDSRAQERTRPQQSLDSQVRKRTPPQQPLKPRARAQERTPPRQPLNSEAQRRGPRQRSDSKRGPQQQPNSESAVDLVENRVRVREDSRPRYQLLPQSYERRTRFTRQKEEDDDELDEELEKFATQYPQDEADEAARLHHKDDFEGHGMSFEKPQVLSPDVQISFDLHGDSFPPPEQLGNIVTNVQLSTSWASAHFGGDYTRFSFRDGGVKPFNSISPVQHALLTMSQRSDLGVNARREASKKIGSSTTKV